MAKSNNANERKAKILKKIKEKLEANNKIKPIKEEKDEKEKELETKLEDLETDEKKEIKKELNDIEEPVASKVDEVTDKAYQQFLDILKDAKVEMTKEVKDELFPEIKSLATDLVNDILEQQIQKTEEAILDDEIDTTITDIEKNVNDLGTELKNQNDMNLDLMEENKNLKKRIAKLLEHKMQERLSTNKRPISMRENFNRNRKINPLSLRRNEFLMKKIAERKNEKLNETRERTSDNFRKPIPRRFVVRDRKLMENRNRKLAGRHNALVLPSRRERLMERERRRNSILKQHKILQRSNADTETMHRSKLLENARRNNEQKNVQTNTSKIQETNSDNFNKKILRLAGLDE